MKPESNPLQMIAEDEDIRGITLSLMRHHFKNWPDEGPAGAPFFIENAHSPDEALDLLTVKLKAPGANVLGIVIDADDSFAGRAAAILKFAREAEFEGVPDNWPPDGLIVSDAKGRRFGAWIMPDNQSAGMVENMCSNMLPDGHEQLWDFAVTAVIDAKTKKGAGYEEVHIAKAKIYTWLAWQNPPGERLQWAVGKGLLSASAEGARRYIAWCKDLYALESKDG